MYSLQSQSFSVSVSVSVCSRTGLRLTYDFELILLQVPPSEAKALNFVALSKTAVEASGKICCLSAASSNLLAEAAVL